MFTLKSSPARRNLRLAAVAVAFSTLVGVGLATTHAEARDRGSRGGAEQMLQLFDTDGDQGLTQAEIDAGIAAQVAAADADADGALSLEEFGTVWEGMTDGARVRAFQRLDPNGDASVTTAELEERFGDVVAQRDRNGDGVLDRADRGRRDGRRGEGRRGGEGPARD